MTTRHWIVIPDRIGLGLSVILFAVPGLALWLSTAVLLPGLIARGWQPLTAWFAAGGLVFAGLLAAAIIAAATAAPRISAGAIAQQLRVRPMSGRDWRVGIVALVVALALTSMIYVFNAHVWPQLSPRPVFMQIEALKPAQFYLLALWVPFFALNIIGEELSRQFRTWRHVHSTARCVCHTLGRAAHGQYIRGHLCPRCHRRSRISRGDTRAAAVRPLVALQVRTEGSAPRAPTVSTRADPSGPSQSR